MLQLRFLRSAIALGLIIGGFTSSADAQVLYGSVVGTVEDQSGAAVPDAAITMTSPQTGLSRELKTDSTGRFTINNVLPGSYSIGVKAQGFRPLTQSDVEVVINTVRRVDLKLEVGQITEQVTVEASATQLQTDTASVQQNISERAITNIPLAGYRNYQSLLNLLPGTTPAVFQNAVTDSPARSLSTNVNGTNRNNNNTRLDGATNVFIWLPHHTAYVAPTETIETVNVTTNAFDAEQGMAGGAAVTVTTKSGTNGFHGVAFHYHDNQRLRARNFFLPATREKPVSITNITGGTFGGPIVRNKLFFFGGYEGYFDRQGFFRIMDVPAADFRQGDFSRLLPTTPIYDPLTGDDQGRGRQAFPGNVVPPNRISPIARRLLDRLPQPNLPGRDLQNYIATGMPGMNRHNFDGKVNWNRTQSHAIWGKYSHMDALVKCDFVFGPEAGGQGLCNGGPGDGDTVVRLATFGHTLTLRPNLVVDGTFGYTRMDQSVTTPDYGRNIGVEDLGIPGTNQPAQFPDDIRYSGLPQFIVTGYSEFGSINGWQPGFRNDDSYTGTTNVGWIKGSHDIRFGVDVVRHSLNHWQPELDNPRGRFRFEQAVTALNGGPTPQPANAVASLLLGLPQQMSRSIQHLLMTTREWQTGLYLRDRWQATRNLTLNLGLRWEYYPTLSRSGRGLDRYDLATNSVLIGGFGNNPENVGVTASKRLFAPRIGIAYRLGDSTVIRTGYGIAYNPLPVSRPLRGEYPATIAASFPGASSWTPFRPLEQGIPEVTGPDISSGSVVLPPTVSIRTPYEGELRRGYINSWNFVVERRLPGNVVTSAGYIGTKTVGQFADLDINAAAPGAGNTGRPLYSTIVNGRPLQRVASTRYWDGFLDANYHSLQVSANKQYSAGLLLRFGYTWSKAINYTDDDGWAELPVFRYVGAIERNRAVAGYDRTHAIVMGWVWELPFGKGRPFLNQGIGGALLGGWQINGTQTYYSGRPFTLQSDLGPCNCPGNNEQTADVLGPVGKLGGIGVGQQWLDRANVRPVNEPRFGTGGRNNVRGPGQYNMNLSLFRQFDLSERLNLQFRAESFNFTNTPIFDNPNRNINSPLFGQITSTWNDLHQDRQFRFGLRLAF